ncbi:MAG: hypothetical protein ACRC14_02710 [Paracoccaceae bacterium]
MRAQNIRVPVTRETLFPAPTKGWVQSGNITLAGPDQAEVLDNFFPTAQGVRLRGGSEEYANIGTAIVRMMVFSDTQDELFASTATGIYDADRINSGGAAFADVAGLSSGDWSSLQIATAGGSFMFMVNGSDAAQLYNGVTFYPVNTVAVNNVGYDALVTAFAVGQTVTGGTSGATAVIVSIVQTSATAGTLRVGAITGGPFQDNEALTSSTGAATANGASASGSSVTVTGIATADWAQVFLHKSRIFAVEKNSLSIWYLPASSVGGAATEFPLGAIFKRGGTIVFGASWSLDSGAGLDDVCIIITSNGEIAVYEGDDPSDANNWRLAGVYEISRPLNKHSFFKAGGDLAILTEDGIIPVTEALRKDRAALQAVAISYPIEDAWKAAVSSRSAIYPITPTLWQSQALLMIGVPGTGGVVYVANARTGAWCRYTGWDARCGAVSNDQLFFGTNGGKVMQGQAGGNDDGVAYTGFYVPKFTEAGVRQPKIANLVGITVKSTESPEFRATCFSNYEIGQYPTATPLAAEAGALWGSGIWGTFVWGTGTAERAFTIWKTVRGVGYSLAPAIVVTANQQTVPAFEVLATRLRFEVASSI